MMRWAKIVLPPLVAAIVLILSWDLAVRALGIKPFLVPPPLAVARAFARDRRLLFDAACTTGTTSAIGFVLSGFVGVVIGVVLASSRLLERALHPYALVLQTVPIVAIAPLLVLWFGVGDDAVIASAFIVSVFPVITNALAGLRSVEPGLRDLFRLYRASRLARLFKLELPHASFAIATGLRVSCGLAVIGAIVGEFVAGMAEGKPGLGIVVLTAYRRLRTDLLFAAVGCSALLGLGLFALVTVVSTWALRRWHVGAR